MVLSSKLPCLFVFAVCFVCDGYSHHIHHIRKHNHGRRDVTMSISSIPTLNPSSGTEVAGLIEDLTTIEEGLDNLPSDFVGFLEEIDTRLHQQETLLESLLSVFEAKTETDATPSTTKLFLPPPSSITISASTGSEVSTPSSITSSISTVHEASSPSLSTSSCRHGGAGPLVPCTSSDSIPSNPRSLITRTSTKTSYVHATHTASSKPIPFLNTTSYGAAPWRSLTTSITTIPELPTPKDSPPATILMPGYSNGNAPESLQTTTTSTYSAPSASETSYVFKAKRESNVAVYYGQTPTTETGDLVKLCQSDNVDIVVLAFVTSFFENGGMPSASFGPSCKGSTTSQQLHAPGLQDCTSLAPEIFTCQALGKPVLVSLGGYYSNVTFTSSTEAMQLATNLWNLFGAGTGLEASLRPFGSIIIDGFDLDNESHDPSFYTEFATALRTLFASDTSKPYYLSAAPQCPRPDASIPISAMALCDFVFVQFYNNPSCDLSSSGFQSSFAAWSKDVSAVSNSTKLYIGVPGFEGAGTGYVVGDGLSHTLSLARELYVNNLGGVMVWDGVEAIGNVDGFGDDFLVYAKAGLE